MSGLLANCFRFCERKFPAAFSRRSFYSKSTPTTFVCGGDVFSSGWTGIVSTFIAFVAGVRSQCSWAIELIAKELLFAVES
jgi:hypothetical protein